MEAGDRVTVLSGPLRLRDGELVGFAGDKAVVWFPSMNRTERFATDEIAVLSTSRERREEARRRRFSQPRQAGR